MADNVQLSVATGIGQGRVRPFKAFCSDAPLLTATTSDRPIEIGTGKTQP